VPFIKLDRYRDWRSYSISYWKFFQKEIASLMGAMVNEDRAFFGLPYDGKNYGEMNIVAWDRERFGIPDKDQPVVLPATTINTQYLAMLYGTALMSSQLNGSQDFASLARLWVKGAYDDPYTETAWNDLDPARKIEVTVANTGVTYRAVKPANGDEPVGYNMVQRIQSETQGFLIERAIENAESMRRINNFYEFGIDR
jgi:hypothetical protein